MKTTDKKPRPHTFIKEDITRAHTHKEMMMDWLFTEMEEHSKMLQMYADFYDYFQRGIQVDQEFAKIISVADSSIPDLGQNSQAYMQ